MAIVYKKLITCLFGIGAISIHVTTFALTPHPISHKKNTVKNAAQVKTEVPKPVTMPIFATPQPLKVSIIDPKQLYIPQPILPPVNINGNIRFYDFDRHFGSSGTTDRHALSLGGKVNAITDLFLSHFRAGGTVYTAQGLGQNPADPTKQDVSLPATNLTTVGQAYLQLETRPLFIRAGDQIINTPWLNMADTRMIPATYQALYGVFAPWQSLNTPDKNLNFILFRQYRFKSRTSEHFTQDNLYNPANLTATSITALGTHPSNGTLAAGGVFKCKQLNIQAWAYRFYNYSRIYYGDFKFVFDNKSFFKPLIGAQALNNPSDGGNVIGHIPGQGGVKATAYGALLGAQIADGQILLGWNKIPTRSHGYKNGDIVSPYTSGYASDPLYTTSMTAGLVEKAAGTATKLSGSYSFMDHQIVLYASGARYLTQPFLTNSSEIDLDAIYTPLPIFKRSLSIRGRMGFINHTVNGKETYSRLMLEYNFA